MEWKCMSFSRVSNCWGYCSRPKWSTRNDRAEGSDDREWGVCSNHAEPWGDGGAESRWEEPLPWDQRSKVCTVSPSEWDRLIESERVSQVPLCQPLKSGQQDTTEELEWEKSRKLEVNVRKMGKKEANITDFSIMPFLPATGVEKEGKKKKKKETSCREGHHYIKIHWDDLNKKGYKTLPGTLLHGRNAYYWFH